MSVASSLVAFAAGQGSRKSTLRWLIHLGGPGLILFGLIDNSVIPLPGSVDIATIVLAAHHREPWIYYALMATVGALIGGYLTYNMARKTGKDALKERFSKKKLGRVFARFEKWGFAAVAIPAILPPPFPIVPMLVAAGVMRYPTKKFLSALAVGRAIRYTLLAYLGARYGRHIVRFFAIYYKPTLISLIAISVIASLYGFFEYRRRKRKDVILTGPREGVAKA